MAGYKQTSGSRKTLLGIALPPVIGIFFTVFLDLLSFGLFLPDLQLRGKLLGAIGLTMGILQSVYSLAQLITAPVLGRISDHFGRRSVLLITTAISAVAYFIYGHGSILWVVMLARMLLGVAGASVGVAFAYMADVTKPEERAKGLGLLGAAFGLGFILGPAIGPALVAVAHGSPILLGYVGAGLSILNFLYVWLLLPDSKPAHPSAGASRTIDNLKRAFSAPGLGFLLLMFFVINFAFTNLEATYFLLLNDSHWIFRILDLKQAEITGGIVLVIVGIVGAIVQGWLIRILTPKYGEVKLLRFAYLIMPIFLAAVPFFRLWWPGIVVIVVLGFASGLAQPSLSSLISRRAPADMQGGVFGITQSLGAVARLIGPTVSNLAYVRAPYWPYLIGAAIYVFPAIGAWRLRQPEISDEPALETVEA